MRRLRRCKRSCAALPRALLEGGSGGNLLSSSREGPEREKSLQETSGHKHLVVLTHINPLPGRAVLVFLCCSREEAPKSRSMARKAMAQM